MRTKNYVSLSDVFSNSVRKETIFSHSYQRDGTGRYLAASVSSSFSWSLRSSSPLAWDNSSCSLSTLVSSAWEGGREEGRNLTNLDELRICHIVSDHCWWTDLQSCLRLLQWGLQLLLLHLNLLLRFLQLVDAFTSVWKLVRQIGYLLCRNENIFIGSTSFIQPTGCSVVVGLLQC